MVFLMTPAQKVTATAEVASVGAWLVSQQLWLVRLTVTAESIFEMRPTHTSDHSDTGFYLLDNKDVTTRLKTLADARISSNHITK